MFIISALIKKKIRCAENPWIAAYILSENCILKNNNIIRKNTPSSVLNPTKYKKPSKY